MATQADRRAATRQGILDAAHGLFVTDGIPATSTEAIIQAAGVSRGALYHHFPAREDLIAALYEDEVAAAIDRARHRAKDATSPLERLLRGCLAWLDEAARPQVARILIEDGPSALGWQRCREIEGRYSLGVVKAGLQAAADAEEINPPSIDLAALLLNALLAEAALTLVAAPARRQKTVRRDLEVTIRALVSGLR